jgi:hypothetical protein
MIVTEFNPMNSQEKGLFADAGDSRNRAVFKITPDMLKFFQLWELPKNP